MNRMMSSGSRQRTRISYVVSQYPAYSHGFIESEIAAVREAGAEVVIFSINRPQILGHIDLDHTYSFYDAGLIRRGLVILLSVMRHPFDVISLLRYQRTRRKRKGKSRRFDALRDAVYVLQAVYVEEIAAELGVTHFHVHFANNSADVARLAVRWHHTRGGGSSPPWTWSLAIHGPTDFDMKDEIGLADKIADTDLVTCISEYCKREVLASTSPLDFDKVEIVRMGASASCLDNPSTAIRGRPLIIFVGRLVAKKGLADLLAALSEWSKLEIDLKIVGEGPDRPFFESLAVSVPHSVNVEFLGARDHGETLHLIGEADVLCLPSYSEGLPVVLMEALVREVAVLTSSVAGIPELVKNDESGLVVQPGDVDAIRVGLDRLVNDAGLRSRLGQRGREIVELYFNPELNAVGLLDLFESVKKEAVLRTVGTSPPNNDVRCWRRHNAICGHASDK